MEVELTLVSILPLELLAEPARALPELQPTHFGCSRTHLGNVFVGGPRSLLALVAVLDVVTHELLVDRELIEDSKFSVRMWIEPRGGEAKI